MTQPLDVPESLTREVRLYVFREAAETARVPQPPQIAAALGRPQAEIDQALKQLAAGKVLILAPNDGNICTRGETRPATSRPTDAPAITQSYCHPVSRAMTGASTARR